MYDISKIPVVSKKTYDAFKHYVIIYEAIIAKGIFAWIRRLFLDEMSIRNLGLCAFLKYFPSDEPVIWTDFRKCLYCFDLNTVFPFCTNEEYFVMMSNGTQHLCEKRINFVRAVIARYEQENMV